MNNTILAHTLVAAMLMFSSKAFAADDLAFIQAGQSYQEVRQTLVDKGWQPMTNTKIEQLSLYAQEVYASGMTEVKDCISMEIDGCTFVYQKGKQTLEIKTITRQLSVDSFRAVKKAAR